MNSPQVSSVFWDWHERTWLVGNECKRGRSGNYLIVIMIKYNHNIMIKNHQSAARYDSCSGSRTSCHGSGGFLEWPLHHVRTCPAAAAALYLTYHSKPVWILHVLFFMNHNWFLAYISAHRSRAPCAPPCLSTWPGKPSAPLVCCLSTRHKNLSIIDLFCCFLLEHYPQLSCVFC